MSVGLVALTAGLTDHPRGRCGWAACLLLAVAAFVVAPTDTALADHEASVAYVVDTSRSTEFEGGSPGTCGDPNGDGTADTILDCEIQVVTELNQGDASDSPLPVSLSDFAASNTVHDLDPAPGFQVQTDVVADQDQNGVADLIDASRALNFSSTAPNYDNALTGLQGNPGFGPDLAVYFISAGASVDANDPSTGPGSPLQTAIDAGVAIFTFAVNPTPGGCDPGQPLRTIAINGGTCTEVTDTNDLPDFIRDRDHDGVINSADSCRAQPGPASNNGCPLPPDGDGDGVPDSSDQCPAQAGPVSNDGCPFNPTVKCAGRVATRLGTPGAETLRGTPGRDVFVAFGGADTIRGLGGDDLVCAGDGADIVRGGDGKDTMLGEAGNDRLFGEKGSDTGRGGAGTDTVAGGLGNDKHFGDGGRDRLIGSAGNDLLKGGSGPDALLGGLGRDRLIGGPGRDELDGGPGDNFDEIQ